MDLFKVNQDGSRGDQVHDFSPGISPNGLFWVQPVSKETVHHVAQQAAFFNAANLPELDAFNLANSLHGGPIAPVPAAVSFSMLWVATSDTIEFTNAAEGFTGTFTLSKVLIEWSAKTAGFSFVSDPAAASVTVAAIMGEERNGVFFRAG